MVFKNSFSQKYPSNIGIGLDYMSLDLPDNLVISPNIHFQKQFSKRLFAGTKLGVVNYSGFDNFSKSIPERRIRINIDLKPSIALLSFNRFNIKLGAGPSIWYRKDIIVNEWRFLLEPPNQILEFKKRRTEEINLGINVFSELNIKVYKKFSITGSFGVVNFKKAGTSSILGVNAVYSLN